MLNIIKVTSTHDAYYSNCHNIYILISNILHFIQYLEEIPMTNKKRVSYNIAEDVIIKLNIKAAELNITKSELMERLIMEGLDKIQ